MDNLKIFKGKKFHFIGIGGISMSALAQILKREKFYVQGSDETANDEVKKLIKKKIRVFIGHSKENVLGADIVVYSSAISEDNPELVYAKKNNLAIIKRAELLGLISKNYKTVIAVSGSHGKTTTTAMIGEIYENVNYKPTIHLGGKLNSIKSNYKIGNKKYFITENCEYKDNFLNVNPDISVILNIDADHLDYFQSIDGVKNSFYKYAKGTKIGGINLICDQDENSNDIALFENSVSFGLNNKSDIYAKNIKEYKTGYFSFDTYFEKCYLGNIKLNILGQHNVFNALAAVFVCLICGIDFCDIKKHIENFSGVERRCQMVTEICGVKIFHDYAHHPKQIIEMIKVAKNLTANTNGKVITIFEPHTFSRTKYFLDGFAKSFIGSDTVIFAPVYSARESEQCGLNSFDLERQTKKYIENVEVILSYEKIVERVNNISKSGDIIMILGAGTIESLAKKFI